MRVGNKIRLLRVPRGWKDHGEFKTRTLLTKCLGHVLTIKGFQGDDGQSTRRYASDHWVELDIGEVIAGSLDTIWVPQDCVELLTRSRKERKRR